MERFGIIAAVIVGWFVCLAVLYGIFAFINLDPSWMFQAPGESTGYSAARFVYAVLGLILFVVCIGVAQNLFPSTAEAEGK